MENNTKCLVCDSDLLTDEEVRREVCDGCTECNTFYVNEEEPLDEAFKPRRKARFSDYAEPSNYED